MAFPIKECVICGEEFELRPGKPGFANRCPSCSEPDAEANKATVGDYRTDNSELNEARRKTMRDMLYKKEQ
jgi:hypothetical protein